MKFISYDIKKHRVSVTDNNEDTSCYYVAVVESGDTQELVKELYGKLNLGTVSRSNTRQYLSLDMDEIQTTAEQLERDTMNKYPELFI